jgi:hypothetical protein
MKRHLVILATAAGTGMAASSAHAHHSHVYFYDQCKSITIEGRVESVQWGVKKAAAKWQSSHCPASVSARAIAGSSASASETMTRMSFQLMSNLRLELYARRARHARNPRPDRAGALKRRGGCAKSASNRRNTDR